MMPAVAQIDVEMDAQAAAAAEEDGRPLRRQPRAVGGEEQIGLQLLAQALADLAQIGRADLLPGLDDEFGVEAELAAARLAHHRERRHVDAVLALVVGGAAAIDALALDGGPPGIEIVAPFAGHAVDDVAMAVGEHGRQRSILAIVGEQIRPLPARRFDQPRLEIERSKGRLQFLDQISAQRRAGIFLLAFGAVADAAVQNFQELAGGKMLARPGDRVGSGHAFLPSSGVGNLAGGEPCRKP